MSVSGGPTNPCVTLASAASVAAASLATYTLSVGGFGRAMLYATGDQIWDYYLNGRLDSQATAADLCLAGTKAQQKAVAAGAGLVVPVDIAGLADLVVILYNNDADNAMTYSVLVTLVP